MILEKLAQYETRFENVQQEILDPAVIQDMKRYKALNIEFKELEEITREAKAYRLVLANIESSRDVLHNDPDEDMRAMAREELEQLQAEKNALEERLKMLLLPKDPEDSKNIVLEIRAGTGGDEAAIFAGDLYRMYQRYCDRKGLKLEPGSFSEGTMGGFKEIIATVSGENVFGLLKFESGVHRVQRVPATETQGRIHTSAATVAIMPEAEEFELEIKDSEIRVETKCASGPGGQSVNTTYSAVVLTHIPTGITVSMQDEKSQLKNKDKAMRILRARLYDLEMSKRKSEEDALRRSMVSTGDRSAKIRTYNYPQSRVTDHRIGLTVYNLPTVMDGALDDFIEALRLAEQTSKLNLSE